ncbi:MAG: DUF4185 domain-containing protein [Gemmataceae bacterium]|nr:DUF4185 domain-containing protein [Gemmataceae bacterium]
MLALLLLAAPACAEIRVLDEATGRGVPLVELRTVDAQRFVTDNAGRVAFGEPGLLGREVFLYVKSHGYEARKDGFGFAGVRVTPVAGKAVTIKVKRVNIAERLCRLTGRGLWRDSALLGHAVPKENNGLVAGQDSIQAAVYKGRAYWFWGDTLRSSYPLGLFRMAGATTAVPEGGLEEGIPYRYFTGKDGFARATMPLPERPEGVVWVFSPSVVKDKDGKERMAAHYSRRKGLVDELEQGVCVWDDGKECFVSAKRLPAEEKWRHPKGHPIPWKEDGKEWLLYGSPTPNVRVPATLEDVLDPSKYEALGMDGKWGKDGPPATSEQEKKSKAKEPRFLPSGVVLHSGSVRWNARRKRWVMLAGQIGGTSHLGEVWYAEAKHPTGPFKKAVKVATHERMTFYNVCHHALLDRDGGRTIHFEGTYTNEFSGNPDRTPRYDYNQVLYRLDLDDERLKPARVE